MARSEEPLQTDQWMAPKDDTPGRCMCGAVLPPMREWDDYPHQWTNTTCKQCGRRFVEEDDYIAVYDDASTPADLLFEAGTELIHRGHHALGEAVLEVADTLADS